MNRERMLLVRAIARGVPASRLDMGVWSEETACGTIGCVGGWVAQDERARATGLGALADGTPEFGTEIAYRALSDWLEISLRETYYLFHPDAYSRPGVGSKALFLRRVRELLS